MREDTLLSPGIIGNGQQLRWQAAKAISYIEVNAANHVSGTIASAADLKAFFTDCANKCTAYVPA